MELEEGFNVDEVSTGNVAAMPDRWGGNSPATGSLALGTVGVSNSLPRINAQGPPWPAPSTENHMRNDNEDLVNNLYDRIHNLQERIKAHENKEKLDNKIKASHDTRVDKYALPNQIYNQEDALQRKNQVHENSKKILKIIDKDKKIIGTAVKKPRGTKVHGSEIKPQQFYNKLHTLQEKAETQAGNKLRRIKELHNAKVQENEEQLKQLHNKLKALQDRIKIHEDREKLENVMKKRQEAKERENKALMQQFYNRLNALQEKIKSYESDNKRENTNKQQENPKANENEALLQQLRNKLNGLQTKVEAQEKENKLDNPDQGLKDIKDHESNKEPEEPVKESQDADAQESEEQPEHANDETPNNKAQDDEETAKESQDSKPQERDNQLDNPDEEGYDSNFSEDNEGDDSQVNAFFDFWGKKVPKYQKDLKGIRKTVREKSVDHNKKPGKWTPEYTKGLLSEDDDKNVAVISGFQHMPEDEEHQEEEAGEILQIYRDDPSEKQNESDSKRPLFKDNGTVLTRHLNSAGVQKFQALIEPAAKDRPLVNHYERFSTREKNFDFPYGKEHNGASKQARQAATDLGNTAVVLGENTIKDKDIFATQDRNNNKKKQAVDRDEKEQESDSVSKEEDHSENVSKKSGNIPAEVVVFKYKKKNMSKADQGKKKEPDIKENMEVEGNSGTKRGKAVYGFEKNKNLSADKLAPTNMKKKAIQSNADKKNEKLGGSNRKIENSLVEATDEPAYNVPRGEVKKNAIKAKKKIVDQNLKGEELDSNSKEDMSEFVLAENANIPADMLEDIGAPPAGALCKTVGNLGSAKKARKNSDEMSEIRGFSCSKDYDEADEGNDNTKEDIEKSLEK